MVAKGRQTHTDCVLVLPHPSRPAPSGHGFGLANPAPLSDLLGFWLTSCGMSASHQILDVRDMQPVFVASVLVDEPLPSSSGKSPALHPTRVCVPGQPFPVHNLRSKPGILWLLTEGRPRGIRVTGLGVAKLASLGNTREEKGDKQWP